MAASNVIVCVARHMYISPLDNTSSPGTMSFELPPKERAHGTGHKAQGKNNKSRAFSLNALRFKPCASCLTLSVLQKHLTYAWLKRLRFPNSMFTLRIRLVLSRRESEGDFRLRISYCGFKSKICNVNLGPNQAVDSWRVLHLLPAQSQARARCYL